VNQGVKWSKRAKLDMKCIYAFIHNESPKGADKTHARIISAVGLLSGQPGMGKDGERKGTLELTVKISARTTYTVIYRHGVGFVTILRVIHGARAIPDFVGGGDNGGWLM